MIDYIDGHKDRFGVEPICHVLRQAGVSIAPSTYYAAKSRPRSARAVRDEEIKAEILAVWKDNYQVYGEHARSVVSSAGKPSRWLAAPSSRMPYGSRISPMSRRGRARYMSRSSWTCSPAGYESAPATGRSRARWRTFVQKIRHCGQIDFDLSPVSGVGTLAAVGRSYFPSRRGFFPPKLISTDRGAEAVRCTSCRRS